MPDDNREMTPEEEKAALNEAVFSSLDSPEGTAAGDAVRAYTRARLAESHPRLGHIPGLFPPKKDGE